MRHLQLPESMSWCRDAVELLLDMNASTTITNKNRQTPPNLARPESDVWDLLHEEAEWRSLLETQRPCRVRLVSSGVKLTDNLVSCADL